MYVYVYIYTYIYIYKYEFPQIGVPKNAWFIEKIPLK